MLVKLINNKISYLKKEAEDFENYDDTIKQLFGIVDEKEWLIEDQKTSL